MIPYLIILFLGLSLSSTLGIDFTSLPQQPATQEDYRTLEYPLAAQALLLSNWRAIAGDDPAYAFPDDSIQGWKPVKVGQRLAGQGVNASSWCWYQVDFTLPDAWQGSTLKLDLGRISAYDEVFLNGVQCGSYGTPPPNLVHGCSSIYRQYLLPPERLQPGKNTLAVRVFLGVHSGMYEGAYTLQPLQKNAISLQLPLKNSGADSMYLMLSEASHLNRVKAADKIRLAPRLLNPGNTPLKAELELKISNADGEEVIAGQSGELFLSPGQWQPLRVETKAPEVPGQYQIALMVRVTDGENTRKTFSVTVTDPDENLTFSIPVWNDITPSPLPVAVTPGPMGRFGPRETDSEGQLVDNLSAVDSRSGPAYSVRTDGNANGPLLFLANVRPVPVAPNKTGRFHRAAGHSYDGVNDAWIFGRVAPNRAGKPAEMQVEDLSWSGRTWQYRYPDGDRLNFTVNLLSPAWMAETPNPKLRVFEGILRHGIGLPTHLAYDNGDGIQVVTASAGIDGSKMASNWVLAWFNEAPGWDEFDVPYLFVLENRPQRIRTYADTALFFEFAENAGRLQGMPLYGVTLLPPADTATWSERLPEEITTRCRYWGRVLAAPPLSLQRSANVDYDRNRLTVRDEVVFDTWKDAWNTTGLPITPLSNMLPLAASSGNLAIGIDRPVRDLQMATLQGPMLAAENSSQLTFAVDGLLDYLREVRVVIPADNPEIQTVQEEFNRILSEAPRTDLLKQPWDIMIGHGRFLTGAMRNDFTNLLLSRTWMKAELRKEIDPIIQQCTEKYLLYTGMPDAQINSQIKAEFCERPVVSFITHPVSGLKMAIPAPSPARNSFGIDSIYWANLTIYIAWLYADTYDRFDWLKEHYPLLMQFFNTARNSHDWATLASWDTFGGFRVGNGLQEGGGIYAGATALARTARKFGDEATASLAAYHAVMQLLNMQGALAASTYRNTCRPWPASHSRAAEIQIVQKLRPFYFAEINELAGLSQALIGVSATASSPGGYIESLLPEIMRPYQEIWGDFTDELYHPKYDRILRTDRRLDGRVTVDSFVYQTTRNPEEIREVFKLRKQLEQDWWKKMPDYRAYLDSLSKITYRKLW